MTPRKIVMIILIVLAVVLFLQNTHTVIFYLFFWKISMPLIILLPIVFIVGGVIGFIGRKFIKT